MSFINVNDKINRYTRGAIALFLLICMCPFLTVAAVLLEVNRYNNAVALLDEIMGVSSVATLGRYDKFMLERFGLFSMSQKTLFNDHYNFYLNKNSDILGKTISVKSSNIEAMFPLSNPAVLKRQILEYTHLDAPTTIAKNVLPVDELIAQLEKSLKVGKTISTAVGSGANTLNSTLKIYEYVNNIHEYSKYLEHMENYYPMVFWDLARAVAEYRWALNADPEEEVDVYEFEKRYLEARTKYLNVNKGILDTLEKYKKALIEYNKEADKLIAELTKLTASIYQYETDLENEKAEYDKLGEKISNNTATEAEIKYYKDKASYIAATETDLNVMKASHNAMKAGSSSYIYDSTNFKVDSLNPVIDDFKLQNSNLTDLDYKNLNMEKHHFAVIRNFIPTSELDEFFQEQKEMFVKSSFVYVVKGLVSFIKSVFDIDVFYDAALAANIDIDYYDQNYGGLPGGSHADSWFVRIMTLVADLIEVSSEVYLDNLWDADDNWWFKISLATNPFWQLYTIIKTIIAVYEKIIELIEAIFEILGDIIKNIINLMSEYERWWLSAYSTYNMPCRTDNKVSGHSFKAMTGNTYNGRDILEQNKTLYDPNGIIALINYIKSLKAGGNNKTFNGAELEYIMLGSSSEIVNQTAAFMGIYLLRLLINIPFVMSNLQVQKIATGAKIGYLVVILLYLLLEPLADTLVLVNDGSVPMIKKTIFLTPAGLPSLLSKFTIQKFVDLKEPANKALESVFQASSESLNTKTTSNTGKSGSSIWDITKLFDMDYRSHCFILMLVFPTENEQIARIQNVLQMEGAHFYGGVEHNCEFDLRKAYAGLTAEVSADINQFMSMPTLLSGDLFKITRTQMRSY